MIKSVKLPKLLIQAVDNLNLSRRNDFHLRRAFIFSFNNILTVFVPCVWVCESKAWHAFPPNYQPESCRAVTTLLLYTHSASHYFTAAHRCSLLQLLFKRTYLLQLYLLLCFLSHLLHSKGFLDFYLYWLSSHQCVHVESISGWAAGGGGFQVGGGGVTLSSLWPRYHG